MAVAACNVRTFLNGEDISRMVRGLSIDAQVGSVVTVTLSLMPTVTWDADGHVHLDFGPQVAVAETPVAGLRIRGMQLEGDIPVG